MGFDKFDALARALVKLPAAVASRPKCRKKK
jgi:hypothetical protein